MGKAFIYKQIRLNLAWDQAPHCGKREKKSALGQKKSTWEANREVVWGGKRVVALSPSSRIPLYSLRSPIFFLFDPFFCLFSPTAEPGPRLVLTFSLRKCVRDQYGEIVFEYLGITG